MIENAVVNTGIFYEVQNQIMCNVGTKCCRLIAQKLFRNLRLFYLEKRKQQPTDKL